MKDKEGQIIDYLNGALSPEECKIVEEAIARDPEMKTLLSEYRSLDGAMLEMPHERPSAGLQYRFDAFLESQTTEEAQVISMPKKSYRILGYAASIAVLVTVGVLFGLNYAKSDIISHKDSELVSIREKLNMLKDEESVSSRIQAVNVAYDLKEVDPEVVDALLKFMKEDESANVRLAAVEALIDLGAIVKVKDDMLERLKVEEDAFVKIALIQGLAELKEERAGSVLDNIIEDEMSPVYIKDEAHKAKHKLNQI